MVGVAAGTPAGTYSFEYEICEVLNPDNCDQATASVTVDAAEIIARPVLVTGIESVNGTIDAANVLTGDTLGGTPVTPETVTVSPAPGYELPIGISINPDGSIDIAPGTPAGTHVIEYEICEILNPENCSTSTVTITLDPPVRTISGIVYLDTNSNNIPDNGESVFQGWIVEITDTDGNIIREYTTDENGYYEAVLPMGPYTVSFVHPENGTVFSSTAIEMDAASGSSNIVLNLPIDPSGVVYDSLSRTPIPGAVLAMTDSQNTALPEVCFIAPSQQNQTTTSDGFYRFDIVPGADPACPVEQTAYNISVAAPESYNAPQSTIIAAEPGYLTSDFGTGLLEVSNVNQAPQLGEDTTHYFGFRLGAGSRDVVNNHIPLDPASWVRDPMSITKSSPLRDVSFGDLVPYTITVTNTEDLPRVNLDIVDLTPPGFTYVKKTSRLNDMSVDPQISGREITLTGYDFAPNETKSWNFMLAVGAGVGDGVHTNLAFVRSPSDTEISNRAEAAVRKSPDPLFDCSEVIGKVYDDRNKDGVQNTGEPGLAGVRLVTAKGLLITTDHFGRYHIECAAIPDSHIGSNFILKLDESTLPADYNLTTENPRLTRLTRGKMSKTNFGAAATTGFDLKVTDAAFEAGSNTLKAEYATKLGPLIDAMSPQDSLLRLTYIMSPAAPLGRLDDLNAQIQELWTVYGGDHALTIERKTISQDGRPASLSGAEE